MKQIEVRIMGQGYLLSCPDNGEAQLLDAVGRVDAAMCRIRDAGKVKARERIAVLAALNLAYRLAELPPPAADEAPAALTSEDAQARIDALVRTLDRVLQDDGQLI